MISVTTSRLFSVTMFIHLLMFTIVCFVIVTVVDEPRRVLIDTVNQTAYEIVNNISEMEGGNVSRRIEIMLAHYVNNSVLKNALVASNKRNNIMWPPDINLGNEGFYGEYDASLLDESLSVLNPGFQTVTVNFIGPDGFEELSLAVNYDEHSVSGLIKNIRNVTITALMLYVFVCVFVVFIENRKISQSILGLRSYVKKLIINEEYTNNVHKPLHSDIKGLADDIEKMHHVLQSRIEKSKNATQAKSGFLATMSHEIRTPMNGVIGMLELLKYTALGEDQMRYVETASRSADSLLNLINDILDVSKIEAGKIEIEYISYNLYDVIDNSVAQLADSAHTKGLELLCQIDIALPEIVIGDPIRTGQVLLNLISNAVKFTEAGHVIIIATCKSIVGETVNVEIKVSDTGIGIDEKQQPLLFNSFTQADESTTRRFGGSGLGLNIAKKLVELMGGSLSVNSVIGEGSCFCIDIGINFDYVESDVTENDDIKDNERDALIQKAKILVVDDNSFNLDIVQSYLAQMGCGSTICTSGMKALERMAEAHSQGAAYDLVIVDMMMPVMDGFMLADKIRSNELFSQVKLILLSSAGVSVVRAKKHGFDTCLDKPVRFNQLDDVVGKTLSGELLKIKPLYAPQDEAFRGRILLVDDHEVNLMMAQALLNNYGFSVEVAADGQKAFDSFLAGKFDLILMDCQMPILDGYKASALIRKHEAKMGSQKTPIIALTASALAGEKERCLASGMDDYLCKPYRSNDLLIIFERWIPECALNQNVDTQLSMTSNDHEYTYLDKNLANEAKALMGDSYLLFLRTVIRATESSLVRIASGALDGDIEKVKGEAHKLKGALGNVGANNMAQVCTSLEIKAENMGGDEMSVIVRELHVGLNELKTFFDDEMQREDVSCA